MSNQRGFTLILSVAIIGIVLILVALSASRTLIQQLYASVGLEDHMSAKYAAEACAEVALYALSQDVAYPGNETVAVGDQSCSVLPIFVDGGETVVQTEAVVSARSYHLQVNLSSLDPVTVSAWRRVAAF